MRLVKIDDSTYDAEYRASADAIRDFLYMYFEICGDCLPVGDWDRAELGSVDPYRYLDVVFESSGFLFRPEHEIEFLRQGAAVNLLCQLAQIIDVDACSGSRVVAEFAKAVAEGEEDGALRRLSPELQAIQQAHRDGRIVDLPRIQAAFRAGLLGDSGFYPALEAVRREVIVPVLKSWDEDKLLNIKRHFGATMTTNKKRIVPHLWYDKEAKEAAEFYATVFPDSAVTHINTLRDTPSGDCDIVSFKVWGQKFMAISAGPHFKFNPAISFMVNFDPLFFDPSPSREQNAREKLDEVWEKLAEGGTVLMPIDQYPFSERFGWVQDRYGLSWQLILTKPEGDPRPPIVPSMLFAGKQCGKAEEAIQFYLSVFASTKKGTFVPYGAGQEPEREGTVMFADFMLENSWFAAMDSAREHNFAFNEAISFMVSCDNQEEIDHYWQKLSAVPQAEQCGWLKDQFGVSWQVVPAAMDAMMRNGSEAQIARVTQAFLPMKKFDLATLQKAYDGE